MNQDEYFIQRKKSCNYFTSILVLYLQDILNERRKLGYFKEEQRDYIDVFLYQIEKQNELKETTELSASDVYTGIPDIFPV